MTLGVLSSVMITHLHHQSIHQLSVTTTTRSSVSLMATTATSSDYYDLNTLVQHQNTKADMDTHIRQFWDDFPCPPPWRPSILTEVNISKLGPQIGQSVQKFLVGKCHLQSFFPAIRLDPEWSMDEFDGRGDSMGGRGDTHATSTSSSPGQSWCDHTCQLILGLSGVFVAIVIVLIAVVCFHRSRRSHKMPSTRPSRQQLQMSASTSDPVNWAEFSNTQVQFDDDMIYPPFRHRDLPSPPSQCHHPSCNQKWTCPNGSSSFHPLMRVSPASTTYCTRGYTAVYEKIDDEDDEYYDDRVVVPCNRHHPHTRSFSRGEITTNIPPLGYRPANGGVPFIPESHASAARYREEETGFNGENLANFPVSVLPRYFELQDARHNPNTISPPYEEQTNPPPTTTNNNITTRENVSTRSGGNNLPYYTGLQPNNSAFFNSPNNMSMCNQLCATCVSSVVSTSSPPPGLKTNNNNNQTQHELVSNVNSFSCTAPISSTANGISSPHTHTSISGYLPPNNTSSFRQLSNISNIPMSCVDDSLAGIDPPPYTDLQGCDLRCRNNNNNSRTTVEGASLYENDNNDGRSPFTDLTQTSSAKRKTGTHQSHSSHSHHSRACHVTQNKSPIGSPCREWCPSCQQVPLLNGSSNPSGHLHSACPAWATSPNNENNNNNNKNNTQPSQLAANTNTRRDRDHSSEDKTSTSDDNDKEVDNILVDLNEDRGVIGSNSNANQTLSHHCSQQRQRHHETDGRFHADENECEIQENENTTRGNDADNQDRVEETAWDPQSPTNALSLHSHYFHKK